MSEEIDTKEHNVLEDPALRGIFSDTDLLKEEICNYDQDIEEQTCSIIASEETNQKISRVKNFDFPRFVTVEHNSVSFVIEIIKEVEEPIGDDEKPDLLNIENEINVLRTTDLNLNGDNEILDLVDIKNEINIIETTDFKFETFFKQQVEKKLHNIDVVLTHLDQYLQSSSRFCSSCLTLFPTKNALVVHMHCRHLTFNFFSKNKSKNLNKSKNEISKHKLKSVCSSKSHRTGFYSFNSYIFKSKSHHLVDYKRDSTNQRNIKYDSRNACSHCKKIFSSKQALLRHKRKSHQICVKNRNTNFDTRGCHSYDTYNTSIYMNRFNPEFKKCVVVLNKLEIASKSAKLTHGQLKIRKSMKKIRSRILCTDNTQSCTCVKRKDSEYRFRCHICSYYFATARSVSLHLANSHGFKESYHDEGDVCLFDPKCKFCEHHFKNPLSYNNHLWRWHRKYVRSGNLIDAIPSRKNETDNDCVETKASFGSDEFVQENMSDLFSQDVGSSPSTCEKNSMDLDVLQFGIKEGNRKLEDAYKSYKCYLCSFCSNEETTYWSHLVNSHEVTKWNDPDIFKNCWFEKECEYCALTFETQEIFNTHLIECHAEHIKDKAGHVSCAEMLHNESKLGTNMIKSSAIDNTCENIDDVQTNTKTYILKSAYFKCLKCDIHFLSSNIATNHKEHLEMLLNWKCSICKLVFIKEDEIMHELQHAFTETFVVYGVLSDDRIRILYKCPNCAVYFSGDNFLVHYPACENNTPHSKYCEVCDILIADCISEAHAKSHCINKLTNNDFIIVESDVVPVFTDNKIVSKKESPKYNIFNALLEVYYCKFCECYLHTPSVSRIHFEGRCFNLDKVGCHNCGLIFVSSKDVAEHRQIHKKWSFINLNHFDFYDLENNPISPPIPKYIECKDCNIHFSIKNWYLHHRCGNVDFRICYLCESSYEKKSFELHMLFHNYRKINVSIVTCNDESKLVNANTEKEFSGICMNSSNSNVVKAIPISIANPGGLKLSPDTCFEFG